MTTDEKDLKEVKEEPAKTYSEEEYNKAVTSANSKGKDELLKKMEIKSIEEFVAIKEKAEKVESMSGEIEKLTTTNTNLQLELEAVKCDVKNDLIDEIITLAKNKPIADKSILESVGIYATKLNAKKTNSGTSSIDTNAPKVGGQSQPNVDVEKGKQEVEKEIKRLRSL